MLRLSELLGADVRSVDGERVGQVVDMTVELGEVHPAVRRLAIGRRGRVASYVDWAAVATVERDGIDLSRPLAGAGVDLGVGELALRQHVLDTQIVDIAGKRIARVSEVLLSRSDDALRVVAVEVGAAGLWRRLGLSWLARRATEEAVDWTDLHLTSPRGHTLQVSAAAVGVHRLGATELAALMSQLPTEHAAQILQAVAPEAAAGALGVAHPRVGARLLGAVPPDAGSSVVGLMPTDDATAVLRGLAADKAEALLGGVASERAATLRRLVSHPAGTAGGLMNAGVRTAPVGQAVDAIRDRLALDMPELEGLATVFVVDEHGRPLGSFEPNDLLGGRTQPRPVPAVPATLPVERLIDLFALHDYLALPVVDGEGLLIGVVTNDDILAELVAERLPGTNRFSRIRRRAHRARPTRARHESSRPAD